MRKMKPMSRFHSTDIESFKQYIAGCVVVAGDSTLWLDNDEEFVHVAVIHDGSGFTPAAAIHIVESYSHPDSAAEEAFDAMREHTLKHCPEHVKELQKEWGDEWEAILTESFDGFTWTLPKFPLAWAICADKYVARHVDIDNEA
jgi:hypothetical protein